MRFTALLSLAGGVGLLVLLFRWYGSDVQLSLAQLHPGYLLPYLCAVVIVVSAYSARWRMLARAVGSDLPLGRLIGARLAGETVGVLMPSAKVMGDPIRISLVHDRGQSLVSVSAGVALDRLCELVGNVIAATVYVLVFIIDRKDGVDGAAGNVLISVTFLSAAVALPVGMLWYGISPLGPLFWILDGRVGPRWMRWLGGAQAAERRIMGVFRDHPRTLVAGVAMSLMIESLVVIEYGLLLRMCGITLPLSTLLLAMLLGGLSRSLPSPAALGTFEASQVAALTIAGQPAAAGLAVGLIIRLHEVLLVAAGLIVCVARGVSPSSLRRLAPADGGVG